MQEYALRTNLPHLKVLDFRVVNEFTALNLYRRMWHDSQVSTQRVIRGARHAAVSGKLDAYKKQIAISAKYNNSMGPHYGSE